MISCFVHILCLLGETDFVKHATLHKFKNSKYAINYVLLEKSHTHIPPTNMLIFTAQYELWEKKICLGLLWEFILAEGFPLSTEVISSSISYNVLLISSYTLSGN